VIPDVLEAVKATAPLKPLTPAAAMVVDESLLPWGILTVDWLTARLKPFGAIWTGMVT
jgi:hypothetical protein